MTLCDCPGLVMPSFAFSRSEMLLSGVLPVDNMREHFAPIALLASRVPRRYFETTYSVMLPKPAEHEHPESPPTAHQLLTSVAFIRGAYFIFLFFSVVFWFILMRLECVTI